MDEKLFSGILGKELKLFYGNHEYNLKHFRKNLEMDKNFSGKKKKKKKRAIEK